MSLTINFVIRMLRSPKFFYVVVGVLVLQAAWIALTARYPLPFDENFHFGLIQQHAKQLLPFFTHQPDDTAVFGPVARDPSYLYHYLLSFPYRLLTHVTGSVATQIIALRFINIGFFIAGLFVYRKLLSELKIGRALSHTVLLFFVLLPVAPLLAGQINYDNLILYLTGLLFLYSVRLMNALRSGHKPDTPIAMKLVLQILLVGAVGSIVKFSFAPIFFAIIVVFSWCLWRQSRAAHGVRFVIESGQANKLKLILLGLLAVLTLALCVERYGINLLQYHNPVPKCEKVLSISECQEYSPWARDYLFASTYPSPALKGVLVYPAVWVHRTVYETMFSVTSYIYEPWGTVTYIPEPPLTVANYTAWAIVCLGVVMAVRAWRSIWNIISLRGLLIVAAFYISLLFVQNFAMYIHTGEAVAIHGRYLVPIYPILLLVLAIGFRSFIGQWRSIRQPNQANYKVVLLIVTLCLFLQGAGIVGWIIRSDPSWYWQQSAPAARVNWLAKDVLYKVVHH